MIYSDMVCCLDKHSCTFMSRLLLSKIYEWYSNNDRSCQVAMYCRQKTGRSPLLPFQNNV